MPATLASMLFAATLAPPPSTEPPGGYWSISEQRARRGEPLDGEDELTIGSVLFSLGLIRAGVGALSVWMARNPDRCPSDCSGLEIYGWVGVGEGGLMFGTGAVYLAIGASRRNRHQRWQRGENISWQRLDVGPWLLPAAASRSPRLDGGGLQLQLRF